MKNFSKLKAVKKLESLVALQKDCLLEGDWEDFDKIQNELEKLEKEIIEN